MIYQAHRGVSVEYPENTMPAFRAAIEQGYQIIELDVDITADGVLVLLHDGTINRVARRLDGSVIEEPVRISEITYAQASEYDYGMWKGAEFAGTPIARLEEVLALAQESGVRLKIDNKYELFTDAQKAILFSTIKPYEQTAMLTCKTLKGAREAAAAFPNMTLHYDGPVSPESLEALSELAPKERLVVWIPQKNALTTWVKVAFADEVLAAMIKAHAQLGLWILTDEEGRAEALRLGADMVETNGQLKPR